MSGNDFVSMVSHDVLQGRGPDRPQGGGGGATYPGQSGTSGSTSSFLKKYDAKARYKMFDLSRPSEVLELEDVTNKMMRGEALPREERWSHDKDGLTVVTLSWLELTPKKKKKHGPEFYRDGEEPDEDMDGTDEVAHVTGPEES